MISIKKETIYLRSIPEQGNIGSEMGQERHIPEYPNPTCLSDVLFFDYVQAQKKRHTRRHAASEQIS